MATIISSSTVDWKVVLSNARDYSSSDDAVSIVHLNEMRVTYLQHFSNVLRSSWNEKQTNFSNLDFMKALRFMLILSSKLSICEYADDLLSDVIELDILRYLMKYLCQNEVEVYPKKCATLVSKLFSNVFTLCGNLCLSRVPFSGDLFVEMISVQGNLGNRNALAAIIAALYNYVCKQSGALEHISRDKLLIANLCRYLLPVQAKEATNDQNSADDATDWSTKVLWKLFVQGKIRDMYSALSGGYECVCTLEQVVLLSCIRGSMESGEFSMSENEPCYCYYLESTVSFLTSEGLYLNNQIKSYDEFTDAVGSAYMGENLAIGETFILIVDILSNLIIQKDIIIEDRQFDIRLFILNESTFLDTIIRKLKGKVTEYTSKPGQNTLRDIGRSMIESDKRLFTSILRFVANLSYKCKSIQDWLRRWSDSSSTRNDYDQMNENGLHVILSSTSLSYASFGIREWGIVAIRNALEDNDENKVMVEQLKAQAAVNTPALEKMGIKVGIDQNGNVNVSKVDDLNN